MGMQAVLSLESKQILLPVENSDKGTVQLQSSGSDGKTLIALSLTFRAHRGGLDCAGLEMCRRTFLHYASRSIPSDVHRTCTVICWGGKRSSGCFAQIFLKTVISRHLPCFDESDTKVFTPDYFEVFRLTRSQLLWTVGAKCDSSSSCTDSFQ